MGTTQIAGSVAFNNAGTVDVQSGRLDLSGGGTSSGSFDATGTELEFGGGTHTLTGTSSVTATKVIFSGATVNHAGGYTVTGETQVTGGTANLTGSVTNAGTLTISGGTLNMSNTQGTLTTPSMALSGSGTLSGTSAVTVSGTLAWTGGTMSGAGVTNANSTLTINGTAQKVLGRRLNNKTTGTWSDTGFFYLVTGGWLDNQAGATFTVQNDEIFRWNGGSPHIDNEGTFIKSPGVGTTQVAGSVAFNNAGTVDVQSGRLDLSGGGTSSGSFDATGAELEFGGGTHTLTGTSSVTATKVIFSGATVNHAGGYTVTGETQVTGGTANLTGSVTNAGTLTISGGTLNMSNTQGTLTTPSMALSGSGTLSGTSAVTVSGALAWSGGTMSGTGVTNANSTLTINGTGQKALGRRLNNKATGTWSDTGFLYLITGGWLDNQAGATFTVQNDEIFRWNGGSPHVDNEGTFIKSPGVGTSEVGGNVAFNNAGTVEIKSGTLKFSGSFTQSAGATYLNGGSVTTTTALNIQGGVLKGFGTVTGDVSNTGGQASPGASPNILDIAGSYTQGSGGGYTVEIGGTTAGTGHDQLNVTGVGSAAALAGALNVSLINGFTPASGDSFTILTFPSRTGTFAATNFPPLGGGLVWNVVYNATNVVLTVGGGVASADLSIVKTDSPDPVNAGATVTYTLAVSNAGPDTATTLTVTDTLPAGVTNAAASGTGWTCNPPSGGAISCTRASLAVGAAPNITLTATAPGERAAQQHRLRLLLDGGPELREQHRHRADHRHPGRRPVDRQDRQSRPREHERDADLHARRLERGAEHGHLPDGHRHAPRGRDERDRLRHRLDLQPALGRGDQLHPGEPRRRRRPGHHPHRDRAGRRHDPQQHGLRLVRDGRSERREQLRHRGHDGHPGGAPG